MTSHKDLRVSDFETLVHDDEGRRNMAETSVVSDLLAVPRTKLASNPQ